MTDVTFFLWIGMVILIGFAGNLIKQRTKIPESLFLILFGLLLGPISGLVPGESLTQFVPIVSVAAMVVILVESGIGFDIFRILSSFSKAAVLTILIAILTIILVTLFLTIFFDWEPTHAALLGVISSGTTTVTSMALLKAIDIKNKIRRLILLETIINDFTLILGTFLIVNFIQYSSLTVQEAGHIIIAELLIGILIGIIFSVMWRYVLEELNLKRELNYASTIGLCFVLYYVASFLGGNAIISIFAFSLFLGNYYKIQDFIRPRKEKEESNFKLVLRSIRSVQTDFTFFVKSFFFVLLGITFNITLLTKISPFLIGGIVVLIITARFIASSLISGFDKDIAKHRPLISIMIPRGYVAAVLAFVPAQAGIEVPLLTDMIVILIIVTTIIAIFGTTIYSRAILQKKNKTIKNKKRK